jgi:competence protein ComEC
VRPDGQTHVAVLDVGQGDSIFITGPRGQQILIDGGPDLSALTEIGRRMSFFDRSIDVLVLTHPDLDHVASFPAVLDRYRIGAVVMTGVDSATAPYREMLRILKEKQIPVMIADPQQDIDLGDGLLLDILWPPPVYAGVARDDANNTSVITRLTYGEDSILFTGDMEKEEEDEILASGEDLHADILKVEHHGSKTSTSTGFLLAVSPDLAVISAGRDNPFGHPHTQILDRLAHFGVPVRATAWEGTVEFVFDGLEDKRQE